MKEFDVVEFIQPVEYNSWHYKKGDKEKTLEVIKASVGEQGTIIHEYEAGDFIVEISIFNDKGGYITGRLVNARPDQLKVVEEAVNA